MKRRKAIGGILLAGVGGVLAFSGYKWYNWSKKPDFSYLGKKKTLIAALAETIIPATDTPGAKDAGVEEYITSYVKDCADTRSANTFIDGLKEVESYSFSNFKKSFVSCSAEQQQKVLQYFEEKGSSYSGIAGKVQSRYFGKSFFSLLKEYTVEGYCTSELGARNGLAYLYIPGSYNGCMPLQENQKAWATN